MHRLHIRYDHLPNYWLNIVLTALLIIPPGIWGKVTNQIVQPVVEPFINKHIRTRYHNSMLIFISDICKPVSCFRKSIEMFFLALTASR